MKAQIPKEKYYASLARKRMGVGCILLNDDNELLVVKPSYKNHWSVPGGVIDKNESPKQACIREVKEELGLDISELKFLCIEYKSTKGEKDENLQFIFHGGVLNSDAIEKISLPAKELSEYKFVEPEKALPLLNENLKNRLSNCLKYIDKNQAIYFEDGEEL